MQETVTGVPVAATVVAVPVLTTAGIPSSRDNGAAAGAAAPRPA